MGLDTTFYKIPHGVSQDNEDDHESIADYRKFNALHGYCVEYFLDDNESANCTPMYCGIGDLQHLYHECLASLVFHEPFLDPVSGFFFGSQDIDDHYWNQVRQLVTHLKETIESHKEGDKYYFFSWF